MSGVKRTSLAVRIFFILGAMILAGLSGGAVTLWQSYRLSQLADRAFSEQTQGLSTGLELERALLNQGYSLRQYLQDQDPARLQELGEHRQEFKDGLQAAKDLTADPEARALLAEMETEYGGFSARMDETIGLLAAGQKEEAAARAAAADPSFRRLLDLDARFLASRQARMGEAASGLARHALGLKVAGIAGMTLALALGALLAAVIVYQVLFPIRKLSRKTAAAGAQYVATDDLETLTGRVYKLLDEVGLTRDELELSRARLLHSEKMAVVGKLAADVAHSIRNPMTSIKMRLFSLERSLGLNSAQKEDFEVVSEEMRRLDNILRNFLEFSRPPKLRMQTLSLSEIMDQTLQLLQHRLEMCGVKVEYYRGHFLPDIEADPELLKEVMVNLIVNACEAMREGGRLIISEEDAVAEHIGRAILVKITDTGPGIPDSIQDKVLEPFFSTKEEGTGLGLSIALRIVEEHGGRLELRSEEGKGTTFIVTLPLREDKK